MTIQIWETRYVFSVVESRPCGARDCLHWVEVARCTSREAAEAAKRLMEMP